MRKTTKPKHTRKMNASDKRIWAHAKAAYVRLQKMREEEYKQHGGHNGVDTVINELVDYINTAFGLTSADGYDTPKKFWK